MAGIKAPKPQKLQVQPASDWVTVGALPGDPIGSGDALFSDPAGQPGIPETGMVRGAADIAVQFGQGLVGGVRSLSSGVLGADSAPSQALDRASNALGDLISPGRRAEQERRQIRIQEADDSGDTGRQITSRLGALTEAPLGTLAQAVGSSAPTLAAGVATAATGGTGGLLLGAARLLLAPAAVGAVQGLGEAKSSVYDRTYQALKGAGAGEEEARSRAAEAQATLGPNAANFAIASALGAAAGKLGAESVLTKSAAQRAASTTLGRSGMAAAGEGVTEAAQSGQQQYAGNVALGREGFNVDPYAGVAGEAALGAAVGAPIGGAFGALGGAPANPGPPQPGVPPPAVPPAPQAGVPPVAPPGAMPPAEPVIVPTVGPLSNAANVAAVSGAQTAVQVAAAQGAIDEANAAAREAAANPADDERLQTLAHLDTQIAKIDKARGDAEPQAGGIVAETLADLTQQRDALRAELGVQPKPAAPAEDPRLDELSTLDTQIAALEKKFGDAKPVASGQKFATQTMKSLTERRDALRSELGLAPTAQPAAQLAAQPDTAPPAEAEKPAAKAPTSERNPDTAPVVEDDANKADVPRVQRMAEAVTRGWNDPPPIVVLGSMEEAPTDVKEQYDQMRRSGADGAVEGFLHTDGKVYLVADALPTDRDVLRVLRHESLGHAGARRAFGPDFDSVLDKLARARPSLVRAKLDERGMDNSVESLRHAADEVLADLAQDQPELGFVRQAIAAVRKFLRKVGLADANSMTDDEIIREFILPARRAVVNGGAAAGAGIRFSVKKAPGSDIGHKREAVSGRYVGAPDWVGSNPRMLAKLRKQLRTLAVEGTPGRYWYEQSSRAILGMADGDPVEAERIVSLIAIYSPNATVPANTTMALTAYYQWKAGRPIDAGLGMNDEKAEALLREGKAWSGIKTNSFYQNLMVEIDASKLDPGVATMDMWMALAFDYGDKKLDQGPKYKFAERETQRLAKEMGWDAHQVQAAIWTAIKARVEGTAELRKKLELEQGIGHMVPNKAKDAKPGAMVYEVKKERSYDHFRLATKLGMEYDLNAADIEASKYDFSHALRDRTVQISWEATPSSTSPQGIPGIFEATTAQKFEYLSAVMKALTERGKDAIATAVGLPQGANLMGISAWEGKTGAGVQTFVPVPSSGAGKERAVKPAARELLNLYAAAKGYVLSQDAVVWHTPVWDDAQIRQNGVDVRTSRPLSEEEIGQLYSGLIAEFGTDQLAPAYTPSGARVLNFVEGLANKDFQKRFEKVVAKLPAGFGDTIREVGRFRSDGEYISSDREKSSNGQDYVQIIAAGRPDLQRRLDGLRARVAEVNREFAARYGWGDTGQRGDAQAAPDGGTRFSVARPRAGSDGRTGVSAREPRPDAVVVEGVHYGREKVTHLLGGRSGTGIKGAEQKRLAQSRDARIKNRVYFYVAPENGPLPRPEPGLGPHVYRQRLANIFDPASADSAARSKIDAAHAADGRTGNALESAILDAGYDGYVNRGLGMIVVLNSDVPVNYQGTRDKVEIGAPAAGGTPAPARGRYAMMSAEVREFEARQAEIAAAAPSVRNQAGTLTFDEADRGAVAQFFPRAAQAPASARFSVTKTPAFKKWFGDSKVVDENGEPLVVYHGTNKSEDGDAFTRFDTYGSNYGLMGNGSYFTDNPDVASSYTKKGRGDSPTVYPVYLSIKNPLDMDAAADAEGWKNAFPDVDLIDVPSNPTNEQVLRAVEEYARYEEMPKYEAEEMISEGLRSMGYDGITHIGGGRVDKTSTARHRVFIAFDPEQIKSAIGNRGTFDGANPDIRFSLTPAAARQAITDIFQDHQGFNWWQKTVGTQVDKARSNPAFARVFNAAQNFIQDISKFATRAADEAPTLLPKLTGPHSALFKHVSKADRTAIAAPIFEGTLFDPTDPAGGMVWSDTELRQKYKLTDPQIKLYREYRAAIDRSLDDLGKAEILRMAGRYGQAVREQIIDAPDIMAAHTVLRRHIRALRPSLTQGQINTTNEILADAVEKANRITELKNGGYAPLMRFGRHSLTIKSPRGSILYFGLYESALAANRASRDLMADPQFAGATATRSKMPTKSWEQFKGVNPETLEIFGNVMGVTDDEVFQEYLKHTKNQRSAMKRLIHRKGTAGFNEDVPRNLASFIVSNARAASMAVNTRDMTIAVQETQKSAPGDVADEAVKLAQYVQNPTDNGAKVRGLMFVQYLGGSVASALVNMTQPLMMGLPYLAQFTSTGKAGAALARAMKDAVAPGALDPALAAAMARGEREGTVAPQEIHHLYNEAGADAVPSEAWRRFTLVWGSLFSAAEAFNRRTMFIAGFRLAVERGAADPYAEAVKAVEDTQGIYTAANRPNWARGAVGGFIFTFKQFMVAYMEFLKRLPTKQRALALAVLMVAAGAEGLPGADDIDDVIDTTAQALGYNFSSKRAKREWLAKTLGNQGAEIALKGLSAIPGLPIDVAGRLSMGNLLPATGLFLPGADKAKSVLEIAGAGGSLVDSYAKSATNLLRGDVGAAFEDAAPVAVKNAYKAWDMAQTGAYRDRLGRKVTDVDPLDVAAKAIGFQPPKVAAEQRRAANIQSAIDAAKDTETRIAARWARGVFEGNPSDIAAAKKDLASWNAKNEKTPIRINESQIARRVREMKATRGERQGRTAPRELRPFVTENQ